MQKSDRSKQWKDGNGTENIFILIGALGALNYGWIVVEWYGSWS